jgi:hypothetical protein
VLWLTAAVLVAGCSKEAPLPRPQAVDVTAMTIEAKDAPVVYEFVVQIASSRGRGMTGGVPGARAGKCHSRV